MRILLFNLCALFSLGLAGFCTYPPLMTGLASESIGIYFFTFSISIPDQKAIFREGFFPEKDTPYVFLDYKQHLKYEFRKGKCVESPIDDKLKLFPGPPEDAEILSEHPAPPTMPRSVVFRSKEYDTFYVAVERRDATTCYPTGLPYVMLTPTKRIADRYVVKNETISDPSGLNPDLSSCVKGQGWVTPKN